MTPQDQPPAPTPVSVEAQLSEAGAIIEAIDAAAQGRQVADFWLSFEVVRRVADLYQATLRQPPPDPPAPTQEPHRCSGCGHRWDGPLKGTELCGDCWRKGQSAIFAPPATTLRALIEQKIEKWRAKARRFNFEADEDRRRRSVGLAESKEWEASRLLDCAAELKALLTETDGPAPQKEQP
jgi:hypothetical protein